MKSVRFVLVASLVAGLVLPSLAPAQRIAEGFHYDPPTETRLEEEGANAKLLSWWQNSRGRTNQLYFRNTSDQPIKIEYYEFSDCINVIGVTCGERIEGPRIEPGQTLVAATARQRNLDQRYSLMYRFQARFLGAPPAAARSEAARGSDPPDVPPEPRTMGWIPARYEYVDRVMPMLMRNHDVPGVALVLMEGNVVQWSAGYGTADAEDDPVTVRTVFRVGELAEPVIALALHRLSIARAWNVESPVSTWAHAQTIPDGLEGTSAADILSHSGPAPADFALLQHLVEMAEGHDLEVLVQAMVLDPHHLTSMTFVPLASGGMARGHDRSGQPLPASPVDQDDISGSLFSSATDYARFLMEASTLGRRDPATWHRLVRPHETIADEHRLARGLGWIVARARDESPLAFRVGTTPGFTSFALVDEKRKRALVLLTNGDGGVDLTEEVLRFLDPWSTPVVKAYLHPTT